MHCCNCCLRLRVEAELKQKMEDGSFHVANAVYDGSQSPTLQTSRGSGLLGFYRSCLRATFLGGIFWLRCNSFHHLPPSSTNQFDFCAGRWWHLLGGRGAIRQDLRDLKDLRLIPCIIQRPRFSETWISSTDLPLPADKISYELLKKLGFESVRWSKHV